MLSLLNSRALLSLHRRRQHSHQAPDHDTIIPDEFIRPSRLSQNYMRFNARKPASGRTMLQMSPYTGELISYANSGLVEVEEVKETMEGEAVRSLAARVPPELFENILFYVNVNCASQRRNTGIKVLTRNRGEPSAKDILTGLKQCSLVCLFWANRCREHIFWDMTLEIKSYEDAEIFRRYFIEGCSRLTPVHQLISGIRVYQDYESRRSFIHLLYLPAIQDKLDQLFIKGPVPAGFNPAKLDTPHWGIPPSLVVPSSFLQDTIKMQHVHLPSFHHVTKYMRHFACATTIWFLKITWDGQTPTYSLLHASTTVTCHRRPRRLKIDVFGQCTDSVQLALTALMLNPNCPIYRLSDEERVWMIEFMTLLWGHEPDPYPSIGFDVSEQATTMRMDLFDFVFEEAPASADRPASALSMVGIHAYIDNSDNLPTNFDALVNHARTHPTIRALVLLFDSSYRLQKSMKPFVEVLTLETETIELVLAYEKEEERQAVGVDLVTLEPNDCLWADLQGRYGGDKSWEMLQRQLKKKRWMSVH